MGKFAIKTVKTGIKFNLKASNGEVIATSEVYTTERACKAGIESVRKNAPIARLEDQTVEGFETVTNPFLLLLAGVLLTALVQSSSATTSIIIAMSVAGLTVGTGGTRCCLSSWAPTSAPASPP